MEGRDAGLDDRERDPGDVALDPLGAQGADQAVGAGVGADEGVADTRALAGCFGVRLGRDLGSLAPESVSS